MTPATPPARPGPPAPADALEVRLRHPADLPVLARVLGEVHEEDGYPRDWPASPEEWVGLPAPLGAWVVVWGGEPVGHVALTAPGQGDVAPGLVAGPVAVVARLFVSPRVRGLGAGRVLLAEVCSLAGELGVRPVLDVVSADTGAVDFYSRTGWEAVGSGEQEWGGGELVPVHCFAAPLPH
ncbi:GNAT family N-acetyltransferase [Streptomyces sp. NPDC051561]|uniref:GNAT family N-acetyltransferase n=1 Tax=Streptomyces sp. NPDC051561 TaxID=3365658 RepID=UPI0037A6A5B4